MTFEIRRTLLAITDQGIDVHQLLWKRTDEGREYRIDDWSVPDGYTAGLLGCYVDDRPVTRAVFREALIANGLDWPIRAGDARD